MPESIPLSILFEDQHLIVIDKPAGMVVHPAPGHETGTLVNALLHHCGPLPLPPPRLELGEGEGEDEDEDQVQGEDHGQLSIGGQRRPGIVHRLDRDTLGRARALGA